MTLKNDLPKVTATQIDDRRVIDLSNNSRLWKKKVASSYLTQSQRSSADHKGCHPSCYHVYNIKNRPRDQTRSRAQGYKGSTAFRKSIKEFHAAENGAEELWDPILADFFPPEHCTAAHIFSVQIESATRENRS
ncbi:hypothetical protein V8E54_004173 [Elaphomyces granulatus]